MSMMSLAVPPWGRRDWFTLTTNIDQTICLCECQISKAKKFPDFAHAASDKIVNGVDRAMSGAKSLVL